MATYRFSATLWRWPGNAAWYFLTVPKKESETIHANVRVRRGFGSVRVTVTIGESSWDTSIFPDAKSGTYLLPVKKKVRQKEGIDERDKVRVVLMAEE